MTEREYVVSVASEENIVGNEWPEVPLSKVASAVIGGTPARSVAEYWGGNILWATAKDVAAVSSRYLDQVQECITKQGLESSAAKLMPEGTVVITARGTVGALAQLRREMTFNQTCYAILPKDELDGDFLFYALKGTLSEMRSLTYGTVFETITRRTFDNWQIPLPTLSEQRAIAHILGTLDDKIELNRRMNETLEEMARALFKSWFVDFDPVRAKMEGRDTGLPPDVTDLFPDRLVDSELWEIPEGWEVGCLADIAVAPRRGADPTSLHDDTPYIGLEHMPRRSVALTQWEGAGKVTSNKSVFKEGEFLFGKLRPYFHKVGIAPVGGICSTDVIVIAPKASQWSSFVLASISSDEFVAYANQTSTGTKMPRTSWKTISEYRICLPSAHVVQAFQDAIQPMIDGIVANVHGSHTLVALRDTILPKLILGEIRVNSWDEESEAIGKHQ